LKYLVLLIFFVANSSIYGQKERTIRWSSNYKLSWNDFKKEAPKNASAAATTASGISYWFSTVGPTNNIEIDYSVDTFFYPDESWYQKGLADAHVLGHEQAHFDIAELFARKMRIALASRKFTKNVKAEIKKIYSRTIKDLNAYQKRYDTETNFSRNKEQQRIWELKIEADLKRKEPQIN